MSVNRVQQEENTWCPASLQESSAWLSQPPESGHHGIHSLAWVQDDAASRGTGGGSAAWPKSSARWLPKVRAESCSTLWSQCPRDQRCAPASQCRLPVLAEAASVSRKTGLQAIKQRLPARCRECKGHEVRENLASAQIAEIRLLSISSTEALLKL